MKSHRYLTHGAWGQEEEHTRVSLSTHRPAEPPSPGKALQPRQEPAKWQVAPRSPTWQKKKQTLLTPNAGAHREAEWGGTGGDEQPSPGGRRLGRLVKLSSRQLFNPAFPDLRIFSWETSEQGPREQEQGPLLLCEKAEKQTATYMSANVRRLDKLWCHPHSGILRSRSQGMPQMGAGNGEPTKVRVGCPKMETGGGNSQKKMCVM